MTSFQIVNFAMLGFAYWRISATYMLSHQRYINLLEKAPVNRGTFCLFVFDFVHSFLVVAIPVVWGCMSLYYE